MIKIENLTKIYGNAEQSTTALKNISLEVKAGEVFGIIGLSGAGKSTLIRCINMLEKPTQGTITIDGQDMTCLNDQELRVARQKIAMIFQHFNLLSSRTVIDNVILPLEIAGTPRKQAITRAMELLELVGLAGKAKSYPQQLSGGQKQRVGIARALANHPKLLLSDEATSALDPDNTRSILKLLKDINDELGLTILLITHDMNIIKQICDRVAVINAAEIVEINDVLQLFSNPSNSISRSFIRSLTRTEIPPGLIAPTTGTIEHTSRFVRVAFIGQSAGKPIISSMIRKFDIDANIMFGSIDRLKDTPFGNLTLELIGCPEDIEAGSNYLRQNGLTVEVLDNV